VLAWETAALYIYNNASIFQRPGVSIHQFLYTQPPPATKLTVDEVKRVLKSCHGGLLDDWQDEARNVALKALTAKVHAEAALMCHVKSSGV